MNDEGLEALDLRIQPDEVEFWIWKIWRKMEIASLVRLGNHFSRVSGAFRLSLNEVEPFYL
jgi:hypothetical protein